MNCLLNILMSACIAASSLAAVQPSRVAAPGANLSEGCKSAYLMDIGSGECIYSNNELARLPIASVCKVMTLTLCFDEIERGNLTYDEKVTVSAEAAGMGGSQVFLQSGKEYTVDQLIKSIIVCSANDSCVAMSQRVAGSEDEFVAKMNGKAKELGCSDTLFANCTGLPKEPQYSCAKDVAKMFANLLTHEDYYKYSKIWLEDFLHPDNKITSMTNTNKLIRRYPYCDGGKTGFTNDAGFCLASTAKKNGLRLISVVLGGDSSDNRFDSAVNMFEYGFANYKNKIVLDSEVTLNDEFPVKGGKEDSVLVRPERNSYIFSAINGSPEITYNIVADEIKAPVECGERVGKIEVFKDGVLADTVDVVAAEAVQKAGFADYFKKVAADWAV